MKLKHFRTFPRKRLKPWMQMVLVLASVSSIYACQPSTKLENLRHGVPAHVVPGSYKLTVATEAHDEASLNELSEEAKGVAQEQGCGFGGLQALAWEPGAISAELASTYQLKLTDCEQSEDEVADTLRKLQTLRHVKGVEAEASIQLAVAENDPLKSRQYHLDKINREQTCDLLGGKAGQQVVVAVIDSGVDKDHPDLQSQFLRDASGEVIGASFVGKGARGRPDSNWDDQNGHGTHVAGLVGAAANNNVGVVGVASCSNVKIMPVRVMDASGRGSSIEIDRGVQWAASQGADIINLSLGGNNFFAQPRNSHPSALYSDLASKGVTVFAAAGNESLRLGSNSGNGYAYSYPASYDNVISVAATNSRDALASFSNRGSTVDIAAPGDQDVSTYPGGGYKAMSGTSMASPVAAGAYALALSIARNSPKDRFQHNDVQTLLLKAVRTSNLKSDVAAGGVMDTLALAQAMKNGRNPGNDGPTMPAPMPTPTPQPTPTPDEPTPTQPTPGGMSFVGLTDGQTLTQATRFAVTGWPQGKTARIYLYWVTRDDSSPYSFASLDRSDLDATGTKVQTPDTYYLYGAGTLVAEAVDTSGQQLQVIRIKLTGR
ncbi:S8 family peptidase [Oligoflexus tunisiensis]|uniref:S8 family peptidase n=1 Tax=Oligoflexus tunisiensis TaxID=708132 RepID=UPI000B084EFD|nr:S8 family serine peptidase [Oligoflexus tunisiensis]